MRLSKLPASMRDAQIEQLPRDCVHADCTTGLGCREYVASMFGSEAELKRRQSEARYYLALGYSTKAMVGALVAVVASRRGQEAADQLQRDMREQWARRGEWAAGRAT